VLTACDLCIQCFICWGLMSFASGLMVQGFFIEFARVFVGKAINSGWSSTCRQKALVVRQDLMSRRRPKVERSEHLLEARSAWVHFI
jgi:hypothetical protein